MVRKRIIPATMLAGALVLSGCSAFQWMGRGFYDREAYRQCDKEPTPDARRACYDKLDEARRERNTKTVDGKDER